MLPSKSKTATNTPTNLLRNRYCKSFVLSNRLYTFMFKYFEFFRLYVLFDFFTHVVFHVFNFAKILQVTSDALIQLPMPAYICSDITKSLMGTHL